MGSTRRNPGGQAGSSGASAYGVPDDGAARSAPGVEAPCSASRFRLGHVHGRTQGGEDVQPGEVAGHMVRLVHRLAVVASSLALRQLEAQALLGRARDAENADAALPALLIEAGSRVRTAR